jgi:hypothetical protein
MLEVRTLAGVLQWWQAYREKRNCPQTIQHECCRETLRDPILGLPPDARAWYSGDVNYS